MLGNALLLRRSLFVAVVSDFSIFFNFSYQVHLVSINNFMLVLKLNAVFDGK